MLLLSPYPLKQNTLRPKEKKFSKRKGKPKRNTKRKLSQKISNINHCSHNTLFVGLLFSQPWANEREGRKMIKMGGSIPQAPLLLLLLLSPYTLKQNPLRRKEKKRKFQKEKEYQNFNQIEEKTKEKYKEKIKTENSQCQPLFPQHFVCGSPFLPALSNERGR